MSNKVICSLPNAASVIDGIEFEDDDGARVAYGVDDEKAKRFASIPGFEVVAGSEPPPKKPAGKGAKGGENQE